MVVRRSMRARTHAVSVYDEAAAEVERLLEASPPPSGRKRKSITPKRSKKDDDDEEASLVSDEAAMQSSAAESSSDDDSDSDAEVPAPRARRTPPSSTKKKQQPQKKQKRSPKKIHVQFNKKSLKKDDSNAGNLSHSKTKALQVLQRKTLDPKETPKNSLAAAILTAVASSGKKNKKKKGNLVEDSDDDEDVVSEYDNDNIVDGPITRYPDAFVHSSYTTVLEPIVKSLIAQYQQDANKAHVQVLNLLFRSVGGSFANLLDENTVVVDDMDDNEWESVVTTIVDDMRLTPPDSILLCACPKGAQYASHNPQQQGVAANSTAAVDDPNNSHQHHHKQSAAQEEFRIIYEHFWYLLGTHVLLSGRSSSSSTSNLGNSHASASSSFDIECVRDLAQRMIELSSVGQPDLRAAACIGALQLALAACDGTLEFETRLTTATRQLKAAEATKSKTKAEALQHTVASLERSCGDLEQVIQETIVPSVFMKRYRDSNAYNRAFCIDALGSLAMKRPDIFLQDIYLKYFGWMMSDKEVVVRVAALRGLLAPFTRAEEQDKVVNVKSIHRLQLIQLDKLDKVVDKFLLRIAACVHDVSTQVQEQAMKLLLTLMRNGRLDELENDTVWNQINHRALAAETTPEMRRDAMYFVLEQIEAFDMENQTDTIGLVEVKKVNQIDGIAAWVAHCLSDGQIPLELIRVHLTNYVVHSLRAMPEHAHLMTNWRALIAAIQQDTQAGSQAEEEGSLSTLEKQRAAFAKQRVLLQMLACAASLELDSSSQSSSKSDAEYEEDALPVLDPDVVTVRKQLLTPSSAVVATSGKQKKKQSSNMMRESLSTELLKALPQLLEAYKGDLVVLKSLSTLPRYLVMSVVTMPQRKGDVQALTELLAEIFLESTDATVLQNTCLALTVLAKGDHSRNREALLKLKSVAVKVQDRLFQLYEQDDAAGGSGNDGDSDSSEKENEEEERWNSICLCLRRLAFLSKRNYLGDLLALDKKRSQDDSSTIEEQDPVTNLFSLVAQRSAKNLKIRECPLPEDDEASIAIPAIWEEKTGEIHLAVAKSFEQAILLIESLLAWRIARAVELEHSTKEQLKRDDDSHSSVDTDSVEIDEATADELDAEAKAIVRMRDGLFKLLGCGFDQYLHAEDQVPFSPQQRAFVDMVHVAVGKVANDMRSLLPKEWEESASPLLRKIALPDDSHLVGGFVRFFRAKEDTIAGFEHGMAMKEELLLPLSRGLVATWYYHGNRREGGTALAHITHNSEEVSKSTGALCRVLKRMDPVRFLEAHMASLRQCYSDWLENFPEEPSDRPTEEELEEFAEMEREYREEFKDLEHKASKLSASLGVGKIRESKLVPALFGFVKEGLNYAFSNGWQPGVEEEPILGSRLTFLCIVIKYVNWVKKNKNQLKQLREIFTQKEEELYSHPDFGLLAEDDLAPMEAFKKAIGLKAQKKLAKKSLQNDGEGDDDVEGGDEDEDVLMTPMSNRSTQKRRISRASSARSRLSTTSSNLSPLPEEEDHEDGEEEDKNDEDSEHSPPPPKKRRGASSLQPQATIAEDSDEEHSSPPKKRRNETIAESSDEELSFPTNKPRGKGYLQPKTTIAEGSDSDEGLGSPAKKRRSDSFLQLQAALAEGSDSEEEHSSPPKKQRGESSLQPQTKIAEGSEEEHSSQGSNST